MALAPTVAVDGEMLVIAGVGLLVTANDKLVDTPPPGAGFTTVTAGVPTPVRSLARMVAVNCVELK
jgi:hypothetical protein